MMEGKPLAEADPGPDGSETGPVAPGELQALAAAYRRRWRAPLCVIEAEGARLAGACGCDRDARAADGVCDGWRRQALTEALRWGEATVCPCPGRRLIWAVPVMRNSRVLGGVLAAVSERRGLPSPETGRARFDARAACADLRRLVEERNLTNADYLAARRAEYMREQQRAYVLHDLATPRYGAVREAYLRQEPALMEALRRGDRDAARRSLNAILLAIYNTGGGRLTLLKSFVMELVVSMTRTAAELGGDPEILLGTKYASIGDLYGLASEEAVSRWLVEMLERVMDCVHVHRHRVPAVLGVALETMRRGFGGELSRDEVAAACHLSPAHFSRLFKAGTGRTFTDVLNEMRVQHAAERLLRSGDAVARIAQESGFRDQSYFGKVFRRYTGASPAQYRRQAAAG
jgi:AraC-like DNA-binding protein